MQEEKKTLAISIEVDLGSDGVVTLKHNRTKGRVLACNVSKIPLSFLFFFYREKVKR